MALSLDQYILDALPKRGLPWPTMPKVEPIKAKPHVAPIAVKAVLWNVYGTLLAIPTGELQFEAAIDFVTDAALDKTIQEFKMWNSMSRKPGAPAAYMKELFKKAYTNLKLMGSGGERHPEVLAERIWDDIVKKLMLKDYVVDAATYGTHEEFTRKIAYFYHASIQGCGAYVDAAAVLRTLGDAGKVQGLLADGQCFTTIQLQKCLNAQEPNFPLENYLPAKLRLISSDLKARKPSETLFKAAVAVMASRGFAPSEVLHVGSSILRDIVPAKKAGFRTALFAGDKQSLAATSEQLKDPATRPDRLLTELAQITELLA